MEEVADIIRQVMSRRLRWERRGNCTRFWWESPKEKPLGRPRRRWEDGVRMDLRECGLDSTGSGQRPVSGCCECCDEPSGSCVSRYNRW
jgi:hypothetical protein